jgi:hypothetical protein
VDILAVRLPLLPSPTSHADHYLFPPPTASQTSTLALKPPSSSIRRRRASLLTTTLRAGKLKPLTLRRLGLPELYVSVLFFLRFPRLKLSLPLYRPFTSQPAERQACSALPSELFHRPQAQPPLPPPLRRLLPLPPLSKLALLAASAPVSSLPTRISTARRVSALSVRRLLPPFFLSLLSPLCSVFSLSRSSGP